MAVLNLSLKVLDWAAGKAGQSREDLAHSIAKRKADRERILGGELTVRQVEKVAKLAHVPFGYMFLAEPPVVQQEKIPDLRQVVGAQPLSNDFFDTLADVRGKQEWFIDYITENGAEGLPFVGKYDLSAKPSHEAIAQDIKKTLGLTPKDRTSSTDADAYFRTLASKAEAAGVLVMKSGVVRANTRRPLSEREFRGFALAHPIVPVVFVNGQDAEVAAVFTLMHELAHIWLGVSGVSDVPLITERAVESLCNAVAAEALVPVAEFVVEWERSQDIEVHAKHFKVSRLVIARRALDLRLIDQAIYDLYAKTNVKRVRTAGGDGLRTIPVRNSKRFTKAIVSSALSGQTLLREAAALLNSKPDTVVKLGRGGVADA